MGPLPPFQGLTETEFPSIVSSIMMSPWSSRMAHSGPARPLSTSAGVVRGDVSLHEVVGDAEPDPRSRVERAVVADADLLGSRLDRLDRGDVRDEGAPRRVGRIPSRGPGHRTDLMCAGRGGVERLGRVADGQR